MAGRSFRQRPVDIHKQLDIVRDETLLDSAEGLPIKEIVQNQIVMDTKKESVRQILLYTYCTLAPGQCWRCLRRQ